MRVLCIKNIDKPSRNELIFKSVDKNKKTKYIINNPYYNLDKYIGEYDLNIDYKYNVYGIMNYNEDIYYLIIGEKNSLPQWYPSDLFKILDNEKPEIWIINRKNKDDANIKSIESYELLAIDYNHMTDLINKDNMAIEMFLNEKELMDDRY